MPGPLTCDEAAVVSRLWAEGVPRKLIAEEVGRSPGSLSARIAKWRRAGKVDLPHRYNTGPVEDPDGRLHPSAEKAAFALGVSRASVWRWLRDPDSGWRRAGDAP